MNAPAVATTKPGSGISQQGVPAPREIRFEDRWILAKLLGPVDRNVPEIEKLTSTLITCRGNVLLVQGSPEAVATAQEVLRLLYRMATADEDIGTCAIEAAYAEAAQPVLKGIVPANDAECARASIRTPLRTISARSTAQAHYMRLLATADMTFAIGPAGTGKTYLAVAQAISQLLNGSVERLIFSRPAVEAGEKLGFLPGDMKEKVDPYLRPIYDALHDCMPPERIERGIANGTIEIAPIAFMRGRTLANAFVILDEAQNTTPAQMKMFLTRFGENSRMVISGDPNQTDLPGGPERSGLVDAVKRLSDVDGLGFARFGAKDVVRHPLVGRIVDAYDDPDY